MDWYTDWFGTRYYALLYGHRDGTDAAPWVRSIMERWKLRTGDRLLDLACGRGRHAYHFDRAGLQVTGVDLSSESIDEARDRVPGARFLVHDIRTPVPGEPFPFITCLFTSLGYTAEETDDQRVIQAAADGLLPGGKFVLDLMNPTFVQAHLVPLEERVIEGVRFEVRRWVSGEFIHKEILVSEGRHQRRFQERVRMLQPQRVEAMAAASGLVVDDRTDGPDLVPFDAQRSSRYVLWTHKPALN